MINISVSVKDAIPPKKKQRNKQKHPETLIAHVTINSSNTCLVSTIFQKLG